MDKSSYDAITRLYNAFFEAQYALQQQLGNQVYNPDKRDILYNSSYAKDFENAFIVAFQQNLNNKAGLKAFIEDIYYNKLMALFVRFKYLQMIRVAEIGQSAAVNDEAFLIIANGYRAEIARLATIIKVQASQHGIIDLRPAAEIALTDYTIDGRYIYPKGQRNITEQQFDESTILKQPECGLLLYYYSITKESKSLGQNGANKSEIAAAYGYTKPNSGTAIYNHFRFYRDKNARVNLSENRRTDNAQATRFENIVKYLQGLNHKKTLELALSDQDEFLKKYNVEYK